MPDRNKLRTMKAMGYRLAESCSTCEHGEVDGWGICTLESYLHEKHGPKDMPAHDGFTCDSYVMSERTKRELGIYIKEPWKDGETDL